jgi:protein SCO1/2
MPRLLLWCADLLLLLLAVGAVGAQSQESNETPKPPKPPAEFKPLDLPVGAFTLVDRFDREVQARDLLGKIWVVQFFYPGCNYCSRNTPTVQKLQDIYRGKPDVRFVSIALEYNDAETLHEFARSYNADPEQWLFLAGHPMRIREVIRTSFYESVFEKKDPTVGDKIGHTMHLVVIDAHGTMIGYADGTLEKATEVLKEQIDRLRVRRRLEQPIPVMGGDLPWFNATLNSTCAVLLILGWLAIRMRYETLHKIVMLLALNVSMIFLASYLFYHFAVMEAEPTRFQGQGPIRYVYYAVLLSHTILALVVAPLAIYITVQGLRDARMQHVRLARWTLPIWLYVSVTGVVVYWMLYRL